MQRLLILGCGAFALETLDIAEVAGGFDPLGFVVSETHPKPRTAQAGLPVFTPDNVPYTPRDLFLVAAIGSPERRLFIEDMTLRGFQFVSVVHPSAIISPRAQLGIGCVVNAGVVISQGSVIADHVIINRGALIGHDDTIGRFCTIGPGVNIAGGVEVGEGVYFGLSSVIRDHVTIGEGTTVGAGAVVVKPIPPRVTVMGVPAQVVDRESRGGT